MAHFPGYPAATDKINLDDQLNDHPDHHNLLGTAVNFLDGAIATLQSELDDLPSLTNVVTSDGSFHQIDFITTADFAALSPPDPDVWYVITA